MPVLGWAFQLGRSATSALLGGSAPAPVTRVDAQAAAVLAAAHHFYVALDEAGDVLAWNAAAERTFGWSAQEAVGRSAHELIIPRASHAAHLAGLERFRQTGRGRGIDGPVEVEALCRDGGTVPVELSIWAQHTASGWLFHVLGTDVSARRAQERVLALVADNRQALLRSRDADEVRRLLCQTAREAVLADGAYLLEVEGEPPPGAPVPLRLVAESHGVADAGLPRVELSPDVVERLLADGRIAVADLRGRPAAEAAALRSSGLRSAVIESLRTEDALLGVLVLGWVGPRPLPGEADQRLLGLLASEATLTVERLALQEQLAEAARTDALTGLLNRRAFTEGLERALAHAATRSTPLALAMLDLDGFKALNDSQGHPAGDRHLAEVARAWRAALDPDPGELYRFGGDEFALLVPCEPDRAEAALARLVAATPPATGVTVGLAAATASDTPGGLLARADAALYERKRSRPARR